MACDIELYSQSGPEDAFNPKAIGVCSHAIGQDNFLQLHSVSFARGCAVGLHKLRFYASLRPHLPRQPSLIKAT